jgi:uncharacterized damage-inducible protein DinB
MIVTALSLHEGPAAAQKTPSIAGRWSGTMGPTGAQPSAVLLEVKVAGSNITGRITGPRLARPGNIRKGSFDSKTGAVWLEVEVEGDSTVVNFEGRLTNDSIAGKLNTNTNVSGVFSLGRAAIPTLIPPAKAVDTVAMAMQSGFTQVSGWVTRAAQLVPPEKYTYKPVGTVRSFGQMVGHVIDGYAFYCGRGVAKNVQWSDATEKGAVDKATLATKLKQASDACSAAYANGKQLPPLLENIAHTNLHYGNIVTYLRMMGVTPPSS